MSETGKSLLVVGITVVCCVFGCSWYESYKTNKQKEEKIEAKRQDSIRKAFVADSLAHDPHYQDSIRLAKIQYELRKAIRDSINREEVIGFLLVGEHEYHTVLHQMFQKEDGWYHNYSKYDISSLRFVTTEEVRINHYKQCETCEEIETIYSNYESNEMIYIDDIRDYVSDNLEEFKDLFEFEPDYEDDRL